MEKLDNKKARLTISIYLKLAFADAWDVWIPLITKRNPEFIQFKKRKKFHEYLRIAS